MKHWREGGEGRRMVEEILRFGREVRGAPVAELIARLAALRFELIARALPGAPWLALAIRELVEASRGDAGRELVVDGPENTDWLQRRRREGGATDAQEGAEETSHNRGTTNFERDRRDESPP